MTKKLGYLEGNEKKNEREMVDKKGRNERNIYV